MSNTEIDDQDEKPLDPVMERLRQKMVRLQLISAGVIVVSLMAVLSAVVYKASNSANKTVAAAPGLTVPADSPLSVTANVPDGFVIQQTSMSGSQLMLSGSLPDGKRKVLVYDIQTGRKIADIAITGN